MKFIWYEDMKKDIKKVIRELSEFLDIPLTEDQVQKLSETTNIDAMRKSAQDRSKDEKAKRMATGFYRKGVVGGWKEHFDREDVLQTWNDWIEENVRGTDIKFSFE